MQYHSEPRVIELQYWSQRRFAAPLYNVLYSLLFVVTCILSRESAVGVDDKIAVRGPSEPSKTPTSGGIRGGRFAAKVELFQESRWCLRETDGAIMLGEAKGEV